MHHASISTAGWTVGPVVGIGGGGRGVLPPPWKHSLLYSDKTSMSLKAQLLPLDTYIAAVRVCRGLSAQGSVVSEEEKECFQFFSAWGASSNADVSTKLDPYTKVSYSTYVY